MRKHATALRLGLVVGLLLGLASGARAQDADADAAATKFLASKALATVAVPADQWLGSYSGSCWVGAVEIAVVDKDEKAGGLRRIELTRILGREKTKPSREVERWWIDGQGLVSRGERAVYKAGSASMEKGSHRIFTFKNGKLKVKDAEEDEESDSLDVPAAFVPTELLAILFIPDDKGKRYRFSHFGEEGKFSSFTLEDMGKDKATLRSGEGAARKVKITESDGAEGFYFLDDQHRIVAASWPAFPHLTAVGGTEAESCADWWSRPSDELDKAGDALATGPAKLDALVGELTYGYYEEGQKAAVVKVKLAKEASGYRYTETISGVGSANPVSTEWSLSADGKIVSGHRKETGEDATEQKLTVSGDKMTVSSTHEGSEDLTFPMPPRFVPDLYLLLKAVSGEKGEARFHGFDLGERFTFSILVAAKGEEEIALPGGKVKARRVDIAQEDSTGSAWLDASGKILLVMWKSGDVHLFLPEDKLKDELPERVGPPKKED